jgi:hypothetical protein
VAPHRNPDYAFVQPSASYVRQFIAYVQKREARTTLPPARRHTTVGDVARRFFMTCEKVAESIRLHEAERWGQGKMAQLTISRFAFPVIPPDTRMGPALLAAFHPVEDETAPLSRRLVCVLEDADADQ